jgi:hypothetical protein
MREAVEHLKDWIQLQPHLPPPSPPPKKLLHFYHNRVADCFVLRTARGRRIVRPSHKGNLWAVHENAASCILCSKCGLHNGGATNCSPPYVTCHTTSQTAPDAKAKGGRSQQAKSTKGISLSADQPRAFRIIRLRFSVIFLSCKAHAGMLQFNWKRRIEKYLPPCKLKNILILIQMSQHPYTGFPSTQRYSSIYTVSCRVQSDNFHTFPLPPICATCPVFHQSLFNCPYPNYRASLHANLSSLLSLAQNN